MPGRGRDFRTWLVAQVAETKHARVPLADDEALNALAVRLGLQPEVLIDARNSVRVRGRARLRSSWKRDGVSKTLFVTCAREPFLAWQRHIHAWGIDSSQLIRALVYAYLTGSYEPPRERMSRYWIWEGKHVKTVNGLFVQAVIKYGAYLALEERARRLDHTVSALIRALMLENMAGNFGQRGVLTIMDLRSMPEDPEYYLKGL